MKRLKVLLSAYSCEPGRGSERGVGWNVVREIANYHDVWVLTRPDESKEAIEAELARNPVPNLHFVYFTLPIFGGAWRWSMSGAIQIHYYLWQIQAYFVARRLHRQIGFDLTQHVTFVKYSSPSFLSLLPVPFIWGPVGGGESAPQPFWQDFSFKAKVYESFRNLVRWLGEHDPFARLTAKSSAIVRATTQDTAKRLYTMGAKNVQVLPEVGLLSEEIKYLGKYEIINTPDIKFISIGRLLHWKGFHLGLRAFAQGGFANKEYWIVGDGPELQKLQALAQDLGIAEQVKFWGQLSREETLNKLGECHVLIHPSLHDSGGWVCIEAMATGRPVICLDLGGPATQVTLETGIKVAAENPEQAVHELSQAMIRLSDDSNLRMDMGQAGKKLVQEAYSWKVRGQQLIELYEEVTNNQEFDISKMPTSV
jgi:glycosyltransferase involved in cell wall biosynthesis